MSKFINSKVLFLLAAIAFIGFLATTFIGIHEYAGWLLMTFFVFIALAFRQYELLRGYSFTIAIFAAVSLAMYYPQYFITVGDFKLKNLIVPLMQIIMFGM